LQENSYNLTRLKELFNEPDEKVGWLVEFFLPIGGVSMIGGKPKAGNPRQSETLWLVLPRENPFLGFPSKQGGAIYSALEEKRGEVANIFVN
jgi:hypothetical protein